MGWMNAGIEPAPVGGAAADPLTRAALRADRRRAVGVVVAGVLCLIVFMVATGILGIVNDDLRESGVRTTGTVAELSEDTGHSSGSAVVEYRVGGADRSASVDLGALADDYTVGQSVTVFYDRSDPGRMTIDDVDNEPWWLVWPLIFITVGGLAALVGSVVGAVRRRSVHRVLRSGPWRPVRLPVEEAGNRSVFRGPDGRTWRTLIGSPWPTPNRQPRKLSGWGLPDEDPAAVPVDQPLWYVEYGSRAVFSPSRGEPLVLARRKS